MESVYDFWSRNDHLLLVVTITTLALMCAAITVNLVAWRSTSARLRSLSSEHLMERRTHQEAIADRRAVEAHLQTLEQTSQRPSTASVAASSQQTGG